MQKNKLTKGVFSALLLASTVAGAEQQYPAADFQPTIVYQDNNYIAKSNTTTAPAASKQATAVAAAPSSSSASSNEADSKYPAANFQPQVIYSDPQIQHANVATAPVTKTHSVSASSAASTEVDSKYPAANFQPQVIYSDAGSKQSMSTPVATTETETSSEVAVASKPKESDSNYLIALIGLVAAGFFFFRNQASSEAGVSRGTGAAPARNSGGVTGVARYLNRVSGTGVSRYLEKQAKTYTPATGVAKYMAKQVVSAKAAKAEAATGVEKYIRDRG